MALRDVLTRPVPPLKGIARRNCWHPLGKVRRPDATVHSWLQECTSLTQRLQRSYGTITVQVLQQGRGRALSDESCAGKGSVIGRDVLLCQENHGALVFAHSILPLCPRGALHVMFKRLGRQALGSVLFSKPGFVRRQREWALLDHRHPLYQAAARAVNQSLATTLWARRAVFSQLRQPRQFVQVTEVFCHSEYASAS